MPLRVAFDVSELGAGRGNPQSRRGINRVVEEVGGALASLAQAEPEALDFSVTAVDNPAGAAAYVASRRDDSLGSVSLRSESLHRRWATMEENARAFVADTADRAALRRASRWLVSRSVPWQRRVTRRLRAFDPEAVDVFHSPAFTPLPAYVRRARRPACFLTFYDLIPLLHPELVEPVSIVNLKTVLATFGPEHFGICISEHVKNDFCEHLRLDPAHVFVAPLAADAARFHPCADLAKIAAARRQCRLPDDGCPYFLSLCAVEKRKNVLHLIRCFARLRQENPSARDLRLVLVGAGDARTQQQVGAILAAESLADHVILTGYVEDQDLAPLYSGALAFVFPSLAEGFGLPPLEAMQCGVPVICSNRTSLPEVMGDAGLLVDPEEADALCAAMGRVFNEAPLRADLAQRSLARAAQFSWERCAQDHLRAYRTAVRLKAAAPAP